MHIQIEHIALWVRDLDAMCQFYVRHFGGIANEKYTNATHGFSSYFITFESGARLELMHMATIPERVHEEMIGWAHLAFAVGSKAAVDALTERLRADGYRVASEPRITGDGYYESVVLDPEGNRLEITI